jgi:hypothetical protein
MPSTALVYHTFLSAESVRLGRLVRNVDEPQSDYLHPDCDLRPESVIIKPHLDYEEMQQRTADKSLFSLTLKEAQLDRFVLPGASNQ